MKILVLPRYEKKGASSRFRMMQYFDFFRTQGCQIQSESLFPDAYIDALYQKKGRGLLVLKSYIKRSVLLLLNRNKYDVVWIEKELFPWIPFFLENLFLNLLGAPYVLDYDDAVFHSYDLNSKKLVRFLLGKKHNNLMKNARAVIAGNQYLCEKARQAGNRNVVEVPTVVPSEKYLPGHVVNKKPVVGWIGSPSTSKYLELVRGVLGQLASFQNFELRIVGAKVDWPELDVKCIPWSEASEAESINEFDIGIMPLLDSPWEKGKCGFKLIQYMACAKPVVASAVGCNGEIVQEGLTGYLARTDAEWLTALQVLVRDANNRIALGKAGRQRFERLYSLESNCSVVLETLRGAAGEKI